MSDDPGTVQEAPPPPAKEDPETLALRAQPPRAILGRHDRDRVGGADVEARPFRQIIARRGGKQPRHGVGGMG